VIAVVAAAALFEHRLPCSLSLAFPEGGWAPFPFTAYVAIPVFCAAALALLPREQHVLRVGALLYALGSTLAYALETPIGGNATRLGALLGRPLLACALWDRGRPGRRLAFPAFYRDGSNRLTYASRLS
jgi:hypothetical protein